MNYLLSDLNGIEKNELASRLMFDVATARNSNFSLLKFIIIKQDNEKIQKAITSALRALKKKGKITFFVSSLDFSKSSTETEYLFNKYPELTNEKKDDESISYFVKI